MSLLDVGAAVVAWAVLLAVVGRERICDVLEDFRAGDDRRARISQFGVGDELEALWRLPAREPRRLA